MKTWRQKYFEDYEAERIPANNRKGYRIVYTYVGKFSRWSEEGRRLRRRKILYAAVATAMTSLFLLCGTSQTAMNVNRWVAIPGIVAIVALLYCWIGIVQFLFAGERMHERDCKHIHMLLEISFRILCFCFGLCLIFSVFLLLRQGFDAHSLWTVSGYGLCFIAAFALCRMHRNLSFTISEEECIPGEEAPPK